MAEASTSPRPDRPRWTADRLATELPATVRNKIATSGSGLWLDRLPDLIAELESRWEIRTGPILGGGTEAFVAEATRADGTPAVLKLLVPHNDRVDGEIVAFDLERAGRPSDGDGTGGWVEVLASDRIHAALLLERLGPPMNELGIAGPRRRDLLCDLAQQAWRPVPAGSLPSGADKGRWLAEFIPTAWEELDRPCSERTVADAVAAAERRIAAHDDERAVLVHGDVHQWNALRTLDGRGFKLVDPDGLVAEPEYELGILMREDADELAGPDDVAARAAHLAARTGLDASAIVEWGSVERVSTGLVATRIDLQPEGRRMLALADLLVGADS